MITLDSLQLPVDDPKDNVSTLVKIDVERAEVEVVEGGRTWLKPSNLFVIEVHQERFLDLLRDLFAERGLRLVRMDQRPLSLLGREMREEKNWWLVSDIGTLA